MSLTRKLLLILIVAQLGVWAILSAQLHYSVTANFRAFDSATHETIRERINTSLERQYMRMLSESRYWLERYADSTSSGLASLPATVERFPAEIFQGTDVLTLYDATGNVLWSVSNSSAEWQRAIVTLEEGQLNPIVKHANYRQGFPAYIDTQNGPYLTLSLAVFNENTRVVEGYLVMGRRIDSQFIATITPIKSSISLLTRENPALTEAEKTIFNPSSSGQDTLDGIEPAESAIYMVLPDAQGRPLLAFKVKTEKFVDTLSGNPGVTLFLLVSTIMLIYVISLSYILKRLLTNPLHRLKEKILAMDVSSQLYSSLVNHADDIDSLSRSFELLINERNKHESRLNLFASAVSAADDAIAIIDYDGNLIYANPGFEKLTGHSPATLTGSAAWWSHIFDSNAMNLRGAGKSGWEGKLSLRQKGGASRDVEATVCKLGGSGSAQSNYVLLMHDITDTNAQIAEIQRLATAIEHIEDCIIIADTQGRIRYANPAYERRCGLPLAEMIGKQTNTLSHAASPISVYENLSITVLKGEIWRGELMATFGDGRQLTDEAVVSPLKNAQGEIINFVTILHDVTERVRMEEALRKAKNRVQKAKDDLEDRVAQRTEELRVAKESAESANVAKSAFLAMVSHEIRTPLNGILGMIELLADHSMDNEQRRLLGSAHTSSQLLLTLINDILDFSKIEAGQISLEKTAVSLRTITESVVLALAPIAHRKDLRLQSSLDTNLPDAIIVDGIRLQQILLNILGNALKFTSTKPGKQGTVTVTADLAPESAASRPMLRIRIKDNGIGIGQSALDALFKPFTQAESSTTRRFGGTGLGLSISSRLATIMGGEITVHSVEQEGSTFTILLPLTEAADVDTVDLPELPTSELIHGRMSGNDAGARGHVLVAEDNQINQEVIRLQLKAIGFSCEIANDGLEGIELWKNGKFDLVLTDCHMPNMDGFDFAKAIRATEKPDQRIPIIALTANALREESERCIQSGMNECLTKPIERYRLDSSLSKHMRGFLAARANEEYAERISKPAAPNGGLLNMQTFANNIGDDREVQHELLKRFDEEARKNLHECHAALTVGDFSTLQCNAHKLKSAARTIGAIKLADVCVQIEAAAQNMDRDALTDLIALKGDITKELRNQIDREINTSGANASIIRDIRDKELST